MSTNKSNKKTINSQDLNFEGWWKLNKSVALTFQENSKYDKFSFRKEKNSIIAFAQPHIVKKIINPYKCYPNSPIVDLNEYNDIEYNNNIFNIIKKRRSSRNFTPYSISISELHSILHYSYGITGYKKIDTIGENWNYRSVPSGGGLFPLELYIYINNSALPKGIYHFRADNNSLEIIDNKELIQELSNSISADNINLSECSCLVFVTSIFQRTMLKYGERGYRFILQEVGFVGQNISLISEALNLKSCMLGGFIDDDINEILNINGVTETIQSIIVIGK